MTEQSTSLPVVIHPSGHFTISPTGAAVGADIAARVLHAIGVGPSELLLHLATTELSSPLPADLAYLRDIARDVLTALCHAPAGEGQAATDIASPSTEQLTFLLMRVPPMPGAEYLTCDILRQWWTELHAHIVQLAAKTEGGLAALLANRGPQWRTVGRVTFHLAENKRDPDRPFAFVATYTSRLSAAGRPQHLPLARALQEYVGAGDRAALLKLLMPVNEASEHSSAVKDLVSSGAIYRASSWSASDAYRFLQDIPAMEGAGLLVRVPDWWKQKRPPRPKVSVSVGQNRKATLSVEVLLAFDVSVTLDDQPLSPGEIDQLLQSESGLVQLRGQWVEFNREQFASALEQWREVQRHAAENGVSFHQAMRLLAGSATADIAEADADAAPWVGLSAGQWLADALQRLRSPEQSADAQHPDLLATLRPYQLAGVNWLRFLTDLGLGACLADDMGLGKTVQVITLLLHLKGKPSPQSNCSLLVVPASLLGNWKTELKRFAPSLRHSTLHPAELPPDQLAALRNNPMDHLASTDLLLTTYGMLTRESWLCEHPWRLAILDEAQAVKNATTRQSQAARKLRSQARIAMTGTPVENRLNDLWSLFDFLNPGLLGNARDFAAYAKGLASQKSPDYRPLRTIIRPYILRRLKTDRTIINDLPDKIEMKAFCPLSKRQAAIYQQAVEDLKERIEKTDGIQRKGLILATLMGLKQICNHPSQFVGDERYDAADSGKFARLRDLCEELAERQQKVLIFTQFREITDPLNVFLQGIFSRPGLVLTGQTPVARRKAMVDDFQREDGPPFFLLSIKAGGTGLNLTAASVVIHFDRWWNPAVENQATDRAFRIGQKNNVLVHKFVSRGTVEERIDAMIEEKLALSNDLLDGGGERLLTEMSDKELLQFLSLDLNRATEN